MTKTYLTFVILIGVRDSHFSNSPATDQGGVLHDFTIATIITGPDELTGTLYSIHFYLNTSYFNNTEAAAFDRWL